MKARASLFALSLALGAWAAGSAARAEVSVIDDAGQRLRLAAPATRIVSIAPHLTELLFAAGAGAALVGVSDWSDHPAEARSIPRIGDSALLDLERVVALRPEVVVVWGDGSSAAQVQRLRAAGLPVFVSNARSLAHIAETLRTFGRLAGTEDGADARAARFEQRLGGLRARYAQRPRLRVFYQIWHQPLLTINGAHTLSQALAICGADNVFADLAPLTPSIDAEAVLAADPDVIVTGSVDPAGADHLDPWRRFKSLRAARAGHLIVVNPDTLHRATDRIVDGIAALCEKLDALR